MNHNIKTGLSLLYNIKQHFTIFFCHTFWSHLSHNFHIFCHVVMTCTVHNNTLLLHWGVLIIFLCHRVCWTVEYYRPLSTHILTPAHTTAANGTSLSWLFRGRSLASADRGRRGSRDTVEALHSISLWLCLK